MTLTFTTLCLLGLGVFVVYYLLKRRKTIRHHFALVFLILFALYIVLNPPALAIFKQVANAVPPITIQLPGAAQSTTTAAPASTPRPTAAPAKPAPSSTPRPAAVLVTPTAHVTAQASPTPPVQNTGSTLSDTVSTIQYSVGMFFLCVVILLVALILITKARSRKRAYAASPLVSPNKRGKSDKPDGGEWRYATCSECHQQGQKLREYHYNKGRARCMSALCNDCAGRLQATPLS